jgi:hypothetical protein
VLSHDLVQLLLVDVMPNFIHSGDDVVLGNEARAVSVELIEESLQLVLVEEGLHIESRCQELRVVNFLIAVIVNLVNNSIHFFLGDGQVAVLDCNAQFFQINKASPIFINLLEFFTQLENLILVSHFNQHVHCSFL